MIEKVAAATLVLMAFLIGSSVSGIDYELTKIRKILEERRR